MNIYSIKDSRGDFSPQLVCFSNDDQARRSLQFLVEGSPLYKRCPEDFCLFRIGEFDFASGIIDPESTPVYICSVLDSIPKGEINV